MSPLFHKKQYAFAHPKLVLGTLCCAFVCATIAFSAFHFGSEPPRRLWSPIVIETNGNETVLGDSRQLEFWTPSIRTQDYLHKAGGEVVSREKWQVVTNDDVFVQFGAMLHSKHGVLGYRRVEVWGQGRTDFKPGWWWTVNVSTDFSPADLRRAYEQFWKSGQIVFVEVMDSRGRKD
jgi:hypothetical protein